jgi:hypothetical protein
LPDDKIVHLGGVNSVSQGLRISRFNADGSPDTSLSPDGNVFINSGDSNFQIFGNSLTAQSDSKLIITGGWSEPNQLEQMFLLQE